MTIADVPVGNFLTNLLAFKEGERSAEDRLPFRRICQACLHTGLYGEGGVPNLYSIGSIDEHALRIHPEIFVEPVQVLFEGMTVGPFLDIASKGVHGGIDRGKIGIVCIVIFILNESPGPGLSLADNRVGPKERNPNPDQDPVDEVEQPSLGMVVVLGGNRIAMGQEVEGIIRLHEEFLSQLSDQRGFWHHEFLGPDVGHWQENLSHVDPPSPGSNGDPVGKQPQLWWNRVYNIPFCDSQDAQPEFRPVRPIDCSAHMMQFASRLDQPWFFFTGPQYPQDGVIQGCPKDGAVPFNM